MNEADAVLRAKVWITAEGEVWHAIEVEGNMGQDISGGGGCADGDTVENSRREVEVGIENGGRHITPIVSTTTTTTTNLLRFTMPTYYHSFQRAIE